MQEAIGQLKWRALVYAGMREPIITDINDAKTVAVVSIPVPDKATDAQATAALQGFLCFRLVVPEARRGDPGFERGEFVSGRGPVKDSSGDRWPA